MKTYIILFVLFCSCGKPDDRIAFRALDITKGNPVVINDLPIYRYDSEDDVYVYCEDENGNKVMIVKKNIKALKLDGKPFIEEN